MKIEELHRYFLQAPNVYIDSRKVKVENKGIFFALQGADDGNLYAEDALKKGCTYAVVDNPSVVKNECYLLVDNVLDILQKLSKYHRTYCNVKILALTGSNGKTTTKELIYRVLKEKFEVVATEGNLNNHIGVPLSLLRLTPEVEIGVIEMGASGVGEIDKLCRIALPDIGLITNIGDAHSEKFGSAENIVKTKKELFDYVSKNKGLLFVNVDNNDIKDAIVHYDTPIFSYGRSNAQVIGRVLESIPLLNVEIEGVEIHTELYGRYNIENILAAYSVGLNLQVPQKDIIRAIEGYKPTNNRSQYVKSEKNLIIMDAYNANASSMQEILEDFFEQKNMPNRFCILGDMKELSNARMKHKKIKDMLLNNGFENRAFLVGSIFCQDKDDKFTYFESVEELKLQLVKNPIVGKQILVKGSRSIGLDKIEDLL